MSPNRLTRRRSTSAVAVLLTTALAGSLLASHQASAVRAPEPDPIIKQFSPDRKTKLVMVRANTPAKRTKVNSLGLDVTEHGTAKGVEVILHGARDARILRKAGFTWKVRIADLEAHARKNARKDARYARRVAKSALPSGRTSYRNLADYNADLRWLHRRYPRLTKLLTLENESVEGRKIRGIEITTNPNNIHDGKPVFFNMGAHHAREWPSSEHAMEYAFDLLAEYKKRYGDSRAKKIVRGTRTIIVPIVNVDGFVVSRTAEPLGDFSQFDYEMKRKNCSISENTPEQYLGGTCDDNPAGRLRGTDLNRNYPGFWGGPGASAIWSSDTYRGDGPGSEPEVDGVRQLISERQVTTLITNHTYSNLVLRPPSLFSTGYTPDEPMYKALGDSLAEPNQYTSQAAFQLYDTSGSTEDWSYWNTGGFGFTFEIGPSSFHPPYETGVVAEYLGLEPAAGAGLGGNRESYYRASMATLDKSKHSTIKGTAPKGRKLHLYKRFITQTSPVIRPDGSTGIPQYYEDVLTSSLRSKGGSFDWDVNPSTRPLVAGRWGREAAGPPQETVELTNPDGIPAQGEYEETTFTIEGPPDVDNATATVEIGWAGQSGATDPDWDVDIYDSEGNQVGQAATLDNPESAMLIDPAPGEYTVRVTNYLGGDAESDWSGEVSFRGPDPGYVSGLKEAWMLTCSKGRKELGSREVIVDRGETVRVGKICSKRAAARSKR